MMPIVIWWEGELETKAARACAIRRERRGELPIILQRPHGGRGDGLNPLRQHSSRTASI